MSRKSKTRRIPKRKISRMASHLMKKVVDAASDETTNYNAIEAMEVCTKRLTGRMPTKELMIKMVKQEGWLMLPDEWKILKGEQYDETRSIYYN